MDRFGIPNPRKSGSVIGADRQRFGPSCVLLKRVPQGRTESGGIVLAANAGPRVPSGGVTLKRRCTYRPSVIYLIVNKLLSLSLSLSLALSDHSPLLILSASLQCTRSVQEGRGGALSNITFFCRPDDVWRLERETMNEVDAGHDRATPA